MKKVSLVIEGSPEELLPVLHSLLEAVAQANHAADKSAILGEAEAGMWTERQVRMVWRDLTFEAQRVIRKVATQKEGYKWERLKRDLKLEDGRAIGGRISSVGHQLRLKGFKNLPGPLRRVLLPDGIWNFTLDPVWRETVMKLEEERKEIYRQMDEEVEQHKGDA